LAFLSLELVLLASACLASAAWGESEPTLGRIGLLGDTVVEWHIEVP